MFVHPDFDPVAVSIGPLELFGVSFGPVSIHWYGLMYILAFASAWLITWYRSLKPWSVLSQAEVEDLIFYGALGVVVGGRCGYVFFYNFNAFLDDPVWLFRVWEGGMSFHGGLLGVMLAMGFYCKKIHRNYIDVMDFVVPAVPLGLGFGRLGNFIGQELWGRETTVPWGMVFPRDPESLVRHPSQLYQGFLEGFVLFSIVFWYSRKPRSRGSVSALLLIFYGVFRFLVEFVREPDAHIGFDVFDWLTRGQILSIPMVLGGVFLLYWSYSYAKAKEK